MEIFKVKKKSMQLTLQNEHMKFQISYQKLTKYNQINQ